MNKNAVMSIAGLATILLLIALLANGCNLIVGNSTEALTIKAQGQVTNETAKVSAWIEWQKKWQDFKEKWIYPAVGKATLPFLAILLFGMVTIIIVFFIYFGILNPLHRITSIRIVPDPRSGFPLLAQTSILQALQGGGTKVLNDGFAVGQQIIGTNERVRVIASAARDAAKATGGPINLGTAFSEAIKPIKTDKLLEQDSLS